MARTVPVGNYQGPGNLVTAGLWNSGPKALNDWMSNRPMFRGIGLINQNIPNATWTAVQLGTTVADSDNGHSIATNNTRYTCQVAGWYWVTGTVGINPSGVGNVASRMDTALAKNGGIWIGASEFMTKGNQVNWAQMASGLVQFAVGDYVEIWVRQFTGITLGLDDHTYGTGTSLSLLWVHT